MTSTREQQIKLYFEFLRPSFNKEGLIALCFLWFILGVMTGFSYSFYNEFRVLEILFLLTIGLVALLYQPYTVSKIELLFFAFIALGSFFWDNSVFLITDMLLVYLLYKSFYFLNYDQLISKIIVISSLLVFLLLPISLWDYINTGVYFSYWYPLPWNIRTYNSYFLITSVFAVWFYLTEAKYKNIYLLFLFLSFLSILLDAGRSAILAYTAFITIICIFNRSARWQLISVYGMSWLTYLSIVYLASLNIISSKPLVIQIVRVTTSQRYDLWVHAFQCWLHHPIVGCGFYQLDSYTNLAAHPHSLFIQVLTETGLIGFGFLIYMMLMIIKRINWRQKQSHFVVAALLAISIDMSLSGVHIYPITQIALLWLLVFLLKNPVFSHAQYFNQKTILINHKQRILPSVVYVAITIWFIYLFTNTSAFLPDTPITPPRFWVYGYQLF